MPLLRSSINYCESTYNVVQQLETPCPQLAACKAYHVGDESSFEGILIRAGTAHHGDHFTQSSWGNLDRNVAKQDKLVYVIDDNNNYMT